MMQLVRLEIGIGNGEEYHYQEPPYDIIHHLRQIILVHFVPKIRVYAVSSSNHTSELAPRTAAFCVLSSEGSNFTLPR